MKPSRRGCLIALAVILGIAFFYSIGEATFGHSAQTITPSPVHQAPTRPPASPVPTPTPTPKPVKLSDRATGIANGTTHIGTNIAAAFASDTGTLTVAEYLDTNKQISSSSIIFSIKQDCFAIQQALWQAHLKGVSSVELDITAPLQDKFGNVQKGQLASCLLTAQTASHFNWGNLTADMAWQDYDQASYLPSLNS